MDTGDSRQIILANLATSDSNGPYYTCATCSAGNAYTNCNTCNTGTYLYPSTGGECLDPCPAGYWGRNSDWTCQPCYSNGVNPYSCKTCHSPGTYATCDTCYSGTFLYGGECINPCPASYWGDTSTNTCKSCYTSTSSPYTCTTCTGPANDECTTCATGYLYAGQCISSCPIGYYPDSPTHKCKKCFVSASTSPFSCRSCDASGSSNCQSCTAGTYLYPSTYGQCLDPCPNGYWGDITTWTCQPCYNPSGSPTRKACTTCFGPGATSCLTCASGTYFFSEDNSCLSTCPGGFYSNGLSNPNNLCVECYQNNPPSYPDGTCLTCSGSNSNQCQSCGSLQYLDSTTGKCVNTCPIGYYADPPTNTCIHCYQAPSPSSTYQSCYTCVAGTSTDCTACLSGTFLYQEDQTCLNPCPNGWYGYLPTKTCKICYQYTSSSSDFVHLCHLHCWQLQ